MHGLSHAAVIALLLCPSPLLSAMPVYRCLAPDGHITFTHHGCPTDQQPELQESSNARPRGSAIPMKNSASKHRPRAKRKNPPQEPTIVGQQDDGCGNRISDRERREAIIREEVRSGMTRMDIESALGKPDRVSSRNGLTSYHYRDNEGNRRQVVFDEQNCVKQTRSKGSP